MGDAPARHGPHGDAIGRELAERRWPCGGLALDGAAETGGRPARARDALPARAHDGAAGDALGRQPAQRGCRSGLAVDGAAGGREGRAVDGPAAARRTRDPVDGSAEAGDCAARPCGAAVAHDPRWHVVGCQPAQRGRCRRLALDGVAEGGGGATAVDGPAEAAQPAHSHAEVGAA
eukprot:scaffold65784_cov60-Phaeocystis_antarctica.AAC.5